MRLSIPVLVGVALVAFGCDDKPQKNPFDPPPKETKEPPPITEVPKPKGPPELAIDDMGPKVGFTRILLDKPEGKSKLEKELQDNKAAYDGKEATLSIVRRGLLGEWEIGELERRFNTDVSDETESFVQAWLERHREEV